MCIGESWSILCHIRPNATTFSPAHPSQIVEDLSVSDPHADFRLWLSSAPNPNFPISILRRGLKMTTEPPAGLRANMATLYNLVSPVSRLPGFGMFAFFI